MENNKCDCSQCENWESCEIKMVIHNPITLHDEYAMSMSGRDLSGEVKIYNDYEIKKGDKIGQLILCKHEGWLLPSEYTKDEERTGGFGSTDKENK